MGSNIIDCKIAIHSLTESSGNGRGDVVNVLSKESSKDNNERDLDMIEYEVAIDALRKMMRMEESH